MTGWKGQRVLYFGDHPYTDLADASLLLGWHTGAIIKELTVNPVILNFGHCDFICVILSNFRQKLKRWISRISSGELTGCRCCSSWSNNIRTWRMHLVRKSSASGFANEISCVRTWSTCSTVSLEASSERITIQRTSLGVSSVLPTSTRPKSLIWWTTRSNTRSTHDVAPCHTSTVPGSFNKLQTQVLPEFSSKRLLFY